MLYNPLHQKPIQKNEASVYKVVFTVLFSRVKEQTILTLLL